MPSFTVFRPQAARGALLAGLAAGFALLLGLWLISEGSSGETGLEQLPLLLLGPVYLALGLLFLYWTWACLSLSYVVDRNALTIRWGSLRQVIPLDAIERLIPAVEEDQLEIAGVNLPGYHVGRGRVEAFGDVLFYTTHKAVTDVLFVQTPSETYAISVPDPVFFAQTVQSNQDRGPLLEEKQAVHRWGLAAQTFWLDPQARILTLGLTASFIAVLTYVLQTYPGLEQNVELRFPSLGGSARIAPKSELLDLPRTAAGIAAIDLVLAVMLHSWERMVGYVLLLAGIAIQVTLLIAAIIAVA